MTKTKCAILILTLLLSFISCKEKSISEVYNNCYKKEMTVKGVSIKHFLKGFEKELIKSNLLKDSTGKSYKELFFELKDYECIVLENKYSFLDSINGLEFNNISVCAEKIANHPDYPNSIFGKLNKYMEANNGDYEGFFESEPIEVIFNEDTFEFDFIKHKLFNTIKVYDTLFYEGGQILCKTKNCPERKALLYN